VMILRGQCDCEYPVYCRRVPQVSSLSGTE
jgi:hypothetical protein